MNKTLFGASEWYKRDKEDREKRRKANEISLLNQRIQRLMAALREEIESNEQFKGIVQKANGLTRINVMRIYGCQQYESDEVAFRSLECLLKIIPQLPRTDDQKRQWVECERLVFQLVNIDWKYNKLLHQSYDEAKRKQHSLVPKRRLEIGKTKKIILYDYLFCFAYVIAAPIVIRKKQSTVSGDC